jgi:hypothetical protein
MVDFDKSVCLYYSNYTHRGPGKVVQNLVKGLEGIGVVVSNVFSSRPSKYTAALQYCHPELLQQHSNAGSKILMGPNLFVLPSDNPQLCKMFSDFVVPSGWVAELYRRFPEMDGNNLHIWPVGIETEKWKPDISWIRKQDLDCFIYFKNRSKEDLRVVEAVCRKFNLRYRVLEYGSYDEHELQELCHETDFAILLTGTESQGIAYMQILSTDTPCYVFNNSMWKSDDGKIQCPASSVPYFDGRCGSVNNNVQLDHFAEFLSKVRTFEPRKYVLESHTLEKSAEHYFKLLRMLHGEK